MSNLRKSAPGLVPCASHEAASRGRLHPEPESATRLCFQRDRDRIIHCGAFRRLEYKTQVFVNHVGDNYRTRLTHTLEVAQIARSVCRYLKLNEDLGEALALAHDLGHPPFGHAGEDALQKSMQPFGGFDHNAQSLSVITRLEQRYADFDGLNLTWETLEGVVKHNGPLGGDAKPLPREIAQYAEIQDLELSTYAGPEAQVASLSDDIAYNNHDIDDGLRAGLFGIGDLADVPLVGQIFADVARDHPDLDESRRIHEAVRRLIGAMVDDLLEETATRLKESGARTVEDVRRLGRPVAAFSDAMAANDRGMKDFLFENMYRHEKVNRMTADARLIVSQLFQCLLAEPAQMPPDWAERGAGGDGAATARVVADYVAGMTDRFAASEHDRLVRA